MQHLPRWCMRRRLHFSMDGQSPARARAKAAYKLRLKFLFRLEQLQVHAPREMTCCSRVRMLGFVFLSLWAVLAAPLLLQDVAGKAACPCQPPER